MKVIQLRAAKFNVGLDPAKPVPDQELSYREQLLAIARLPPGGQGGLDIVEIRKALRVVERLTAARDGDAVELEDADWEFLVDRLRAFHWGMAHQAIIDLVDAVENAKSPTKDVTA